MFNINTVKAVAQDLWEFIKAGFSNDVTNEKSSDVVLFQPGQPFLGNMKATDRIRLHLTSHYDTATLERPLQQSEGVLYFLRTSGVSVTTEAKNWSPGTWHEHLRGQAGVHISVVPTVGAVIEYRDDAEKAVTAYVHEMDDNETLRFGTVGMYEPGIYEEIEAPVSVWHEFRPVFITFL